ncbi:MAG: hypothetical protein RL885_01130 [Planctomycetota bacterium]
MKRAHSNRDRRDVERIRRIARRLDLRFPIEIVFTFNRSTMISYRRRRDGATLRLHDVFRKADPKVLEAVIRSCFVSLSRTAAQESSELIHGFLHERHRDIEVANLAHHGPPKTIGPAGRAHDLGEIFHRVRRAYFPRKLLRLDLTWSRRVSRHTMGQWCEQAPGINNLISINRLLDDRRVPTFYLEYLMYHEILHEVMPPRLENGRRIRHFPEFKEREREFERYEEAIEWERATIGRLYADWERRRWTGRRSAASDLYLPPTDRRAQAQ